MTISQSKRIFWQPTVTISDIDIDIDLWQTTFRPAPVLTPVLGFPGLSGSHFADVEIVGAADAGVSTDTVLFRAFKLISVRV